MSQSYVSSALHIVFSTKYRRPDLHTDFRYELHRVLGGIAKREGGIPISVGGVDDHVHMLVLMPKDGSLATMMKGIKGASSRWINKNAELDHPFRWQGGYFAISVSPNRVDYVIRYIDRQEKHHQKVTCEQEYNHLLREAARLYEYARIISEGRDFPSEDSD